MCTRQLVVDFDIFVVRRRRRQWLNRPGKVLVLAELDRLGYAVLGYRKVFGSEPADKLSLFVFHHYGLNHQLRIQRQLEGLGLPGRCIGADLLRTRSHARNQRRQQQECRPHPHR